jgi:hypothetical protein
MPWRCKQLSAYSSRWANLMSEPNDGLLTLLAHFAQEDVQYVLIGGHAVRLNGYVRGTEDIDILLPSSVENGLKVIRALDYLPSSKELNPAWFEVDPDMPDNIRVWDQVIVDLLFAANGESYESLQSHIRVIDVQGITVRVLDIAGLLKTKTDFREKDILDKAVLQRIAQGLNPE